MDSTRGDKSDRNCDLAIEEGTPVRRLGRLRGKGNPWKLASTGPELIPATAFS